jgi:hypothetical protein
LRHVQRGGCASKRNQAQAEGLIARDCGEDRGRDLSRCLGKC